MDEIDAREIAEQVGLEDIAWCLDFINKAPSFGRASLVAQLKKEVYAYQSQKAEWEEYKKELQKMVKDDNRLRRAIHKNKLNATIEFLVYLDSAAEYRENKDEDDEDQFGLGDFKISEAAHLEVMQLLLRLKIADESGAVEKAIKERPPLQPTKKRIESLIRAIHKVYKITGISDTLKAILPLI